MPVTECELCCDENCKVLELDEEHWKSFKSLCGEQYNHDGALTKEEFEKWDNFWKTIDVDHTNNYASMTLDQDPIDWDNFRETFDFTHTNNYDMPLDQDPIDWDNFWKTIDVNHTNNYANMPL
jgi:hypothetical protein